MQINLAKEERALLLELVEARIKELHPEIRRSSRPYRDGLIQKRDALERCLEHLRDAETPRAWPSQQELYDPEA